MSISRLMQMGAAGAGGGFPYWIALLGSASQDQGEAVAIDSADNIIVTGNADGLGSGNEIFVGKYNSSGTLQWLRSLGGASNDSARAVAIDSSGNIIVAGDTTSDGAGSRDLLIAKYNSSGGLQWDRTLGGVSDDFANAVAIDSADNIIVAGYSSSDGAGGRDLLIAKYNSSGVLQWDRILGGASDDSALAVAIDSADNIIAAGYSISDGAGGLDFLIAKYNSSGALQWDRTLGGASSDFARGVAIDSADNIIVVGQTESDGVGNRDFLIAKYNSSGVLQWDRTLGGVSAFSQAYEVAIDSADNIIVVGNTNADGAGNFDFLIAKYNSSGALQWDRTLGGASDDLGNAMAIDSADNIIVVGETSSDGAGGVDILIAKLPPDGSGTGTYGSFAYEEAVLTDAEAVLTDAPAVLTDAAAVLTDAEAVLTDAPAVLTEELIEITP